LKFSKIAIKDLGSMEYPPVKYGVKQMARKGFKYSRYRKTLFVNFFGKKETTP